MQRVEAKQPLNAIDTTRFTLPTPGADASEEEWKAAVDNARAQLEHQKIRCVGMLKTLNDLKVNVAQASQPGVVAAVRRKRVESTQLLVGSRRQGSGEAGRGAERRNDKGESRAEEHAGEWAAGRMERALF